MVIRSDGESEHSSVQIERSIAGERLPTGGLPKMGISSRSTVPRMEKSLLAGLLSSGSWPMWNELLWVDRRRIFDWKEKNTNDFNVLINSKFEKNSWKTIACYLLI